MASFAAKVAALRSFMGVPDAPLLAAIEMINLAMGIVTTWRVAAARAVRVLTTCRTRRGPTCGARPKRGGLA